MTAADYTALVTRLHELNITIQVGDAWTDVAAAIEALQADAETYRWLCEETGSLYHYVSMWYAEPSNAEQIRMAVQQAKDSWDAARAASVETGGTKA